MGESGRLDGRITDFYVLGAEKIQTVSAKLYSVEEQEGGEPASLWMMNFPLDERGCEKFIERMQIISKLGGRFIDITGAGIDSNDIPFMIIPSCFPTSIFASALDVQELERRFKKAISLVIEMHKVGLVCGDICLESFSLDRSGEIKLLAVMGNYNKFAADAEQDYEEALRPYLSPEVLAGNSPSFSSDVYALGVVIYRLITGHVNDDNLNDIILQSKFPWLKGVLIKCLEQDPELRYRSAEELLNDIAEQKRAYNNKRDVQAIGALPDYSRINIEQKEEKKITKSYNKKSIILFILIGLIIAYFANAPQNSVTSHTKIDDSVPIELRNAISLNYNLEIRYDEEELMKELHKWENSTDQMSYGYVVQVLKKTKLDEIRAKAEKILLKKLANAHFVRTIQILKGWLNRQAYKKNYYLDVMNALDPMMELSEKELALKKAYMGEAQFAIRLTTALAFDTQRFDGYQPILAPMVGDALNLSNAADYSIVALIMLHPQLSNAYINDVIQNKDRLTNAEVLELLPMLVNRGDINVRVLADLALSRKILSPIKASFLEFVTKRDDMPQDVMNTLMKAAVGKVGGKDLASIGRWMDIDSEKVLLTILADSKEKELQKEAFEMLAGKGVNFEPVASMLEWITNDYWDKRLELAHAIGVLGLSELMTDKEIEDAIDDFQVIDNTVKIVDFFASLNQPKVLVLMLKKYRDKLRIQDKVKFLKNKNKQVRLTAIDIFNTNNVAAILLIIDSFNSERDLEVKAAYCRHFEELQVRSGCKNIQY